MKSPPFCARPILTAGEGAPSPPPGNPAPAVMAQRRELARHLGRVGPYLLLSDVSDIFLSERGLWVDRGNGSEWERGISVSPAEVRSTAVRLIALGGRHIDEAHPCVDVRLADGIRVHAVLAPIAVSGTEVSIRLPAGCPLTLRGLTAQRFFGDPETGGSERVRALLRRRKNLLISGATGAGKTTLLTALLGEVSPAERIIAVEDVAELGPVHPQFVSLQARQPNLEGEGEISVARLLREALRMRPDRLVLGECRGGEIRELFGALNTGHDGGAGTIHANSLGDVPARLHALGALAGLTERALTMQALSAISAVLHVSREGGHRRLVAIGRFEVSPGDRLKTAVEWRSPEVDREE